jgi:hypothetical protein
MSMGGTGSGSRRSEGPLKFCWADWRDCLVMMFCTELLARTIRAYIGVIRAWNWIRMK